MTSSIVGAAPPAEGRGRNQINRAPGGDSSQTPRNIDPIREGMPALTCAAYRCGSSSPPARWRFWPVRRPSLKRRQDCSRARFRDSAGAVVPAATFADETPALPRRLETPSDGQAGTPSRRCRSAAAHRLPGPSGSPPLASCYILNAHFRCKSELPRRGLGLRFCLRRVILL